MAAVSKKVIERIKIGLKKYQDIVSSAKARDVNESDTVTIITDILGSFLGYDKYSEITSEYAIRNTYCDLAIKLDGKLNFLLEVKAVGIDLKDQHVKQAIDYAANQGVDWVWLTNGIEWRIYKVIFAKPVNFETVISFDLLNMSHKNQNDLQRISLLTKEAWMKEGIEQHHSVQQVLNRFTVGAIMQGDAVVSVVKRELKRLSSEIKPDEEVILAIIKNEVLKRDIIEGDKADIAKN